MQSSLKPKQTDDPHDIVVVAPAVAPADDELSSLLHDAARRLSQAQARAASEVPAAAVVPPVDTTFRPTAGNAAVNNVLVTGRLRSIGRGAMRAFAAVLLATCIGLAGFAWRHFGDAAQQTIADWMPQLALTSLLPADQPAPSAQPAPPAVEPDTSTSSASAPAQPAPPAQAPAQVVAPGAAALPADSSQSLQSMARDLASMGQEITQLKASIEQLKSSQQQMSRDIAKASEPKTSEIKAPEQTPRPRIAAPRPAPAPARKPMPPPPPPLAAAAPMPQAAASSMPRQIEPPPQAAAQPPAQEFSPVPRPPMPLTPGPGSFQQ
jgi:hypothetical protein